MARIEITRNPDLPTFLVTVRLDDLMQWHVHAWPEDLRALLDMLDDALSGEEVRQPHDWTIDPLPDENLADRIAPVWRVLDDPARPGGFVLGAGVPAAGGAVRLDRAGLEELAGHIEAALAVWAGYDEATR